MKYFLLVLSIFIFGCTSTKYVTEVKTEVIHENIDVREYPLINYELEKPFFERCGSRICISESDSIKLMLNIQNYKNYIEEITQWAEEVCSTQGVNCIGETNGKN